MTQFKDCIEVKDVLNYFEKENAAYRHTNYYHYNYSVELDKGTSPEQEMVYLA